MISPSNPLSVNGEGAGGEVMQQLPPNELYQLRRAVLEAEGKDLSAQMARLALRQLLLEIERKHKLLGTSARLDTQTGIIEASPAVAGKEDNDGPGPDAVPPAPRPA